MNIQAPWIGREPPERALPCCPICGSDEAEEFYFSRSWELFGCDKCVKRMDYYELEEPYEL